MNISIGSRNYATDSQDDAGIAYAIAQAHVDGQSDPDPDVYLMQMLRKWVQSWTRQYVTSNTGTLKDALEAATPAKRQQAIDAAMAVLNS